ncbi:hypothetical protein SEVIR_3G370100v4 [Setaria viridis]|uniref:Bifunctional inhibitor/plant lipid transfer protein/seed storage helical domain-containing protein n=1 Tax=Setaria viridis TaxID=4556 RepID=A0A4U6VHI8_SETVI|nr:hypothetical protein SEVIR_3G370100v2 [Setaria viridis]
MAPCRFRKHQGVAAGGLALLAALVVVGLALPGGAAAQEDEGDGKDVDIPESVQKACFENNTGGLLACASGQEKDIQGCCGELMSKAGSDCACGVLKVIKGRGIDPNNVCNTNDIEKACQ